MNQQKKKMSLKLKKYIYKNLASSCSYKGGRNRTGRITVAHRGLLVL